MPDNMLLLEMHLSNLFVKIAEGTAAVCMI